MLTYLCNKAFFSLCASDANDSPRGMDFLFDKNRLNVANSRAQSLAIVVGNPNLINCNTSNIKQQKLVNVFCQLFEYKFHHPTKHVII